MGIDATAQRATYEVRRITGGRIARGTARAGFVARGLVYLLIGLLALRIAFSDGASQQADRGGALAEVARQPFGLGLVWAIGVGFAGLAVWRLSQALTRGESVGHRLLAAGRFVFYGVVGWSVIAFAAGNRSSGSGDTDRQSKDLTATALDHTGGVWLVGTVGAGFVIAGGWLAVRAVRRAHLRRLRTSEMSRRVRRVVDVLGTVGGTARGVVCAAAGVFVIVAAVRREPGRAKGMDDTLRSFAHTPAGPWLLVAVAVGLAVFGVFSCAEARWRRL
ncbi:DUF1206 domain-containing protein [Streptomyces sp. VRA16 Mangrove soil]|uniref:DUF1206 domain-containing protein n=1 Tax=Streptomyces sp. VRA16 Mangrove soil TaxID=2817434 RepID=UPI001A9FF99E|nr:DUF1206 domain-containing protein [Streptomyces sp. VRA16 Mangrove soil]